MEYKYIQIPGGCMGVLADYKKQEIFEYQGNPLIEVYDFFTEDQVIKKLEVFPPYDPCERFKDKEYRINCTPRLFQYYQPINRNLELHRSFSLLLRQGYVGRNPFKRETIMRLNQTYQHLISLNDEVNTTTAGFTLIGVSGGGKSVAFKRELSMFPQVIIHETPLNFYQISWLKLECPTTLKGLCIDFFLEVDRLLGTNYQKYANAHNSIETMLAYMVQIARLHYIGALVIDEVQNLQTTKAGGAASILNFFVSLVNKIGIPVVFIGNMEALFVLQSKFRQARRGSGQGDMIWKRMERNEEWDILIEGMWKYQWTKKEIALTEEIKDTIYEESQGIIDIAIKLYYLTQRHVIDYESEEITPRVISMASKQYLNLVRGAIEKLKAGEEIEIPNYEDFIPKVINKENEKPLKTKDQKFNGFIKKDTKQKESINILGQVISALENVELSSEEAKKIAFEVLSKKEDILLDDAIRNAVILALKLKSQMKPKVVDNEKTPQRAKNKEKIPVEVNPDGIRAIINKGREKKQSAYDTLKEAGFIKSPFEEFKM